MNAFDRLALAGSRALSGYGQANVNVNELRDRLSKKDQVPGFVNGGPHNKKAVGNKVKKFLFT